MLFKVIMLSISLINIIFAEEIQTSLPHENQLYTIKNDTLIFDNQNTPTAKPALPYETIKFILPANTNLDSISIYLNNIVYDTLQKQLIIPPIEPPTIRGELFYPPEIDVVDGKDVDIYNNNKFYPENSYITKYIGKLSEYVLCEVTIAPYRYNPITKKVIYISSGNLIVNYKTSSVQNNLKSINSFGAWAINSEYREKISKYVVNKRDVSKFYGYLPSLQSISLTSTSTAKKGYAIITTNNIKNSSKKLDKFISQKQSQGFDTYLVTEDLWGNGSSADQRANNIRAWLQNNYQTKNLKYVLLIGNPNPSTGDVPMKMVYPRNNTTYYTQYKEAPTDFFYADLTGNWDIDGDGKYGEYQDYKIPNGPDKFAEVIVGRIPYYGKIHDLDKILDKIIDYEKAPQSSAKWRNNVLLPMKPSDASTPGYHLGEAIKTNFLIPNNYNYTRIYEENYGVNPEITPCNYSNVEDSWKHGKFGMVVWWTHGWQTGAVDVMTTNNSVKLNDSFPSFTYQVSCLNSYPEYTNNLTYSLLLNGGIATISGTRVTWYWRGQTHFDNTASNSGMAYEYTKRIVDQQLPAGDAIYGLKEDLTPNADYLWMNYVDMMLYGPPEVSLQSATPATYISIKTPQTGDIFGTDDTIKIKWTYSGPKYFLVEFSSDSGKTFQSISMTTDSNYNYIAPNIKSNGCLVRVSNIEGEEADISGMFSINDTSISPKISISVFDSTDEDHSLDVDIMGKIANNGFADYKIVDYPHSGEVVRVGGKVTYIPDENFHGLDSFSYAFQDNNGNWSNKGWSIININSVNDPPQLTQSIPDIATVENSTDSSLKLNNYFYDPDDSTNMFYQVLTSSYLINETFTGFQLDYSWSLSKYVSVNASAINETSSPYSLEIPQTDSIIKNSIPLKGYVSARLEFDWEKQGTNTISLNSGATYSIYYYSIDQSWKKLKTISENSGSINMFIHENIDLPKDALHKDCKLKIVNNATQGSFFFDNIKIIGINYSPMATVREDGTLILTPPNNWIREKNIIISALDDKGLSTFDTIQFKVNNPPKAENISITINEDSSKTVNLVATDQDGFITDFSISDAPNFGTINYISKGVYTYTPSKNYYGKDSIGYFAIDDNNTSSKKAWVKIDIKPINDPPTITCDSILYAVEDLSFNYKISATDPDNVVTLTTSTLPNWLSLSNNTLQGTPNSTSRSQTITLSASDNEFNTQKSIFIHVQNRPIITSTPTTVATQNIQYLYNIKASDANSDKLTYKLNKAPSNMSISNLGVINWTPTAQQALLDSVEVSIEVSDNGTPSLSTTQNFFIKINNINDKPYFTSNLPKDTTINPSTTFSKRYYVKDDDNDAIQFTTLTTVDSATITTGDNFVDINFKSSISGANYLTIIADDNNGGKDTLTLTIRVNQPPVVSDITKELTEDITTSITLSATDNDGTISSFSIVGNNSNFSTDITNKNMLYITPKKDYNGYDTLFYIATDNYQISSNMGKIILHVLPVNDPPQITAPSQIDAIDNNLFTYTPTLFDPDNTPTITYKNLPSWLSQNGDKIEGIPNSNSTNETITVVANDGEYTDSANIDITIYHYPKISSTPSTTTDEDATYNYSIIATDSDNDNLSYTLINKPQAMTISSNNIKWTPVNSDVSTTPYQIIYKVTDNSKYQLSTTDTFYLTVNNTNDAPKFNINRYSRNINENDSVYNTFFATDDDNDNLTFSTIVASTNANISTSTNSVNITYKATTKTKDSVIVQVSDGLLYDTLTYVLNINQRPTVSPMQFTIDEDNSLNITLTGNDNDGYIKYYQIYDYVKNGSIYRVDNNLIYTPLLNYNGADSFSYRVMDNNNSWSKTAWVKIDITPVNDQPKLVSDSIWYITDTQTAYYNTIVYDPDNSSTITFNNVPNWITIDDNTLIANADSLSNSTTINIITFDGIDKDTLNLQTLVQHSPKIISSPITKATEEKLYTYKVVANDIDGDNLSFFLTKAPSGMSINRANGQITWTPTNSDALKDSIEVTVSVYDNGTPKLYDTQNFYIKVSNKNDAPIFYYYKNYTRVTQNSNYNLNYYIKDDDSDSLNFSIVYAPNNTTSLLNNMIGTINFSTSHNDSIIVKVEDDSGAYSIAKTILSVNLPPIMENSNDTIDEDTKITIDLNATDPDGTIYYYALKESAKHGFITLLGTQLIYIPQYNYNGKDSILMVAYDNEGAVSNVGKISIIINAVNDSPKVVSSANIEVMEGDTINYIPQAKDNDDIPSIIVQDLPNYISYQNGVVHGITSRNTLSSTFKIIATDNTLYDTLVVNVKIKHKPIITSTPNSSATQDIQYKYSVIVDDPDYNIASYSLISAPDNMIFSNNNLLWTPTNSDALIGKHTVKFAVIDKDGLEDTQEFTIDVQNINDAPKFNKLNSYEYTTEEKTPFAISFYANDIDNDNLTFTINDQPANAKVTKGTNYIRVEIDSTIVGKYTMKSIVSDGTLKDTLIYTLTVNKKSNINNFITKNSDGYNIVVSPSPLIKDAKITINTPTKSNISFELYNSKQQLIYKKRLGILNNNTTINSKIFNNLKPGVYYLIMNSNSKSVAIFKVVKIDK